MAAYATPDDLTTRHDPVVIGELCGDEGAVVDPADLPTDTVCLAMLTDASGDVEAALRSANRYSVADLEALTGNSLAKLKRIVCTIAMAYLFERRPGLHVETAEAYLRRAHEYLDQLRSGANIFSIEDAVTVTNPTISGPTSYEYQTLNLLTDRMTGYFPSRKQRLPTDRG